MPKYIFHLSGENLDLACSEILSVTGKDKYELYNNFMIVDLRSVEGLEKKLAFTHSIHLVLLKSSTQKLKTDMLKFNWNSIYKTSFKVNSIDLDSFKNQELASIIWKKLRNPKVDLTDPVTDIYFVKCRGSILVTKLLRFTDKTYLKRKAHQRPGLHPTAMHPKLAKSIINLTGAKKRDTILDPFCGSCGLLLEAALMGMRVSGYDIDKDMLERAKKNFKHFSINDYSLKLSNSLKIKRKYKYIVTDLPYGKSTKKQDIIELYNKFLCLLKSILTKRAVVVFPSWIDHKQLLRKQKLKIEKQFSYYIHKSLTRNIVVIKK